MPCLDLRGEKFAVVLAGGSEDVENLGWFERGGLVRNISVDDKTISGAGLEGGTVDLDADCSADDINELMVRVAMTRADPAFVEVVAYKHEMISVGQNLTPQAGFRGEGLGVLRLYQGHSSRVMDQLAADCQQTLFSSKMTPVKLSSTNHIK